MIFPPLLTRHFYLLIYFYFFKNLPPSLCPSRLCRVPRLFMHNVERQSKCPSPMATLTALNNCSGCMRRSCVRLRLLLLLLLTACFMHEAYFGPEKWASWIRGDSLRLSTTAFQRPWWLQRSPTGEWDRSLQQNYHFSEMKQQAENTCTNIHTSFFLFFFFSICAQGRGGGRHGDQGGKERGRCGVRAPPQKSSERGELTLISSATCVCQSEWQGGRNKGEGLQAASVSWKRCVPCCLIS